MENLPLFFINGYFTKKNMILYLLIISLGIYDHDGDGNSCSSSDQYIMALKAEKVNSRTRMNPFRFSSCSISQPRKFLDDLKGLVKVKRFYLLPKLNNLTQIKWGNTKSLLFNGITLTRGMSASRVSDEQHQLIIGYRMQWIRNRVVQTYTD